MILLLSSSVLKEKNNIEELSTYRYLRMVIGEETAKDTKESKRSRRKTKHLLNKVSLNIRHYTLPKIKGGGSHKKKTQSPVSCLGERSIT